MLGSTPAEAQPFAYVAIETSDAVSVIDTATNTVVAVVPLGSASGPLGVAITPDGTHAYVANGELNTVSVIDTATNTVVATVPVGNGPFPIPFGVAITPDGAHAYVANAGSDTVSVIAAATNTVMASVPVGGDPRWVAVTPDGTHAYVTNQGSNTVSVIDTATNTVVASVPVANGPFGPFELAITPDGTHAYVTIPGSQSGTVAVIDTTTNTVVATVPVGNGSFGVAITPDGTHAYVANADSSTVSVIATATNTVVATVPVGNVPREVAITPDGAHAYVTIGGLSNNVSVIDTATNTVVATVPVGNGPGIPFGVAITPRLVTFACPLGLGFWKNHSDAWPVTSLTLGSQTYTQAELLALFNTPPGGDASVILAHQLIATKLSIANGSNPAPISSTIADADNLLSQFSSTLPYNVGTSSDIGQQMVNDANGLDRYNNGELMPDCRPQGVPNSSGSDLQGTNMEITRKLLGGVAAGAACMPEWRAARLDPIVALRRD